MKTYLQAFYLKVLKMSTCPAPLKTKMRRLNNSAFMIKRPRKEIISDPCKPLYCCSQRNQLCRVNKIKAVRRKDKDGSFDKCRTKTT